MRRCTDTTGPVLLSTVEGLPWRRCITTAVREEITEEITLTGGRVTTPNVTSNGGTGHHRHLNDIIYGDGVGGNSIKGNDVEGNGVKGNGVEANGVKGNGVKGNGAGRNGVKGNNVEGNGTKGNGVEANCVKGNGVKGKGVENGVKGNGVNENSVINGVNGDRIINSVNGNGVSNGVNGNGIINGVNGNGFINGVINGVNGNGVINGVEGDGIINGVIGNGVINGVNGDGIINGVIGNGVKGDGIINGVNGNGVINGVNGNGVKGDGISGSGVINGVKGDGISGSGVVVGVSGGRRVGDSVLVVRVTDVYDVFEDGRQVGHHRLTRSCSVDLAADTPAITHSVISRWRALRLEGMDRQRRADPDHRLQRRISAFGQQLASIDSCSSPTDLESIEQLQTRIHLSQELESRLAGCRRELGDLNADVHRHVVLSSSTSDDALKHEVAALYRLLEQISTRLSSQLERLVMLDATWREFLEAGEQLKMALASDRAAMSAVRRAALSGDQLTDEVTRVAQLLTPVVAADGVTQGQQQVTSDTAQSRMCGMREDVSSGYDSASSEEHSERVRRLGRMSRAAGRLQLLLQPTSAAWTGVQHTMTAATSELRDLQATCRDLVIQTTSPVEATQRTCRRPVQRTLSVARVGGAAPFCRLRRVMRVSLPFQLALMLCLCAAYLLEPTCCDNVNVFSMSMIPQLRYISGPPPI